MSESTPIVRAVEAGDRGAWQHLFTSYGDFYETAFDEPVIDGVWAWLMDAQHPQRALVALLGDEIVGFAHYRAQPDTFTAADGWYLDDLFTDPSARGRGTATALIEAIAAEAATSGGGTLRWITADDNERAQRVYDRIATRARWVTYEREC